ncbi:TetR/AcrR family transcriptional regulator [Skermania sp. ID1734]|uniref:TetR/AcrR family transcriptional regulator n=1 Tax=Skermania sp. ID1734 TaxID=2597516 RepID=UPI00117D99D5|nr:TetR/AcrR family transcriptional regulator [Skermania sp. ID1734]TSD93433.1 TetR/AcrR family transcriptional regulator [Skermania sp. ID1734]
MSSNRGLKRGRPPQTPEEAQRVRGQIVIAAGEVFADYGSHATSVTLIIKQAGISRPTFYRYFANASEPLHVLLSESDESLVNSIRTASLGATEGVDLAIRVIDAYLDWARARGPILRPLFAELYDPSSPVYEHRTRAISMLRSIFVDRMVELGRPAPDPLDLDALLNACEFVVYRIARDGQPDAETTARARLTMVRIALATLGLPDDLERALAVPGLFVSTEE